MSMLPYMPSQGFATGGTGWMPSAGTILSTAGSALLRGLVANRSSSPTSTPQFETGSNIDVLSQKEAEKLGLQKKKRRRRRRLLTCSDKADIAFLHGQLGGGALGKAAISTLLSRRCG